MDRGILFQSFWVSVRSVLISVRLWLDRVHMQESMQAQSITSDSFSNTCTSFDVNARNKAERSVVKISNVFMCAFQWCVSEHASLSLSRSFSFSLRDSLQSWEERRLRGKVKVGEAGLVPAGGADLRPPLDTTDEAGT